MVGRPSTGRRPVLQTGTLVLSGPGSPCPCLTARPHQRPLRPGNRRVAQGEPWLVPSSVDRATVIRCWLQRQHEEYLAGAAGATQPRGPPPAVKRPCAHPLHPTPTPLGICGNKHWKLPDEEQLPRMRDVGAKNGPPRIPFQKRARRAVGAWRPSPGAGGTQRPLLVSGLIPLACRAATGTWDGTLTVAPGVR